MKRRNFVKTAIPAGITAITAGTCKQPYKPDLARKKLFSFVHFTDIHVHPRPDKHSQGTKEVFFPLSKR
ncbi:MAG: hypothetical protein HOC71_00760 [Candidatus Latescibacteria bacterium]|jgi:hypothetical protein|nr:hypothetical protein [Candidatus Latescibacterota bacterium]